MLPAHIETGFLKISVDFRIVECREFGFWAADFIASQKALLPLLVDMFKGVPS